MKYVIRLMQEHDLPDILKIERKCYEFPCRKREFMHMFSRPNVFCIVCEYHERAIGYLIYEVRRHHVAMLSLAVDPAFQRKGVAKMMGQKWMQAMSYLKNKVTMIVRDKNLPAQMLLKSLGFKAVVILQSPYDVVNDDGYVMECQLGKCHEFEPANC